ncbi:MAG: hypothetical protein AB7D06_18105 [Pedobacter sp.]
MKYLSYVFIAVSILAVSPSVYAVANANQPESKSEIIKSDETGLEVSELEKSRFEQKFWGLTDEEWALYEKIKPIAVKLGKTAVPSTPPEMLGIFSSNPVDRRKYASLFAKKHDLYVGNTIAWQHAVNEVNRVMYANKPILDPNKMNALRGKDYTTDDRLQFFTKLDCDECDSQLRKLIRQVRLYGMKLDVFFVGNKTTVEDIQKYAEKHVPKDELIEGKITLNKDQGFVKKHNLVVPISFISRGNGPLENHDPND